MTLTLARHSASIALLISFLPLSLKSQAQTTNIAVGTAAIQPTVKRLGINLGTLTFYDSGQTSQNLLLRNPGFEGQIWNSTIRCMSGTPTSCVDDDQWAGWPAGFWNGATFEVFYGSAVGRTGTVTSSTALGAGTGITLNFSNAGTAPSAGDYLIVRKTVPGGASGGWWPATTGAGSIGDNLTDLPPSTLGKQTVILTSPTAADSASISAFFDSTASKSFVQLNGTYKLEFKAKGVGGSNGINVSVSRNGTTPYLSQKVSLTGLWNTYTLTFSAAETGSAVGLVGVSFSTVGADSFELDDVSLTPTTGDPTNTTAYRDPVVNTLKALQPGILRYWNGEGQLGETLDNLLTPQFGRQRPGYSAWENEADQVSYGLHDFLQLCQSVGAEPWFVVPSTFSTSDAQNLIEYLAGSAGTPYGSRRAALGQDTPWSQVFPVIHLEFGNEEWNSTFKGGSIEYSQPYGQRAQAIFGAMRSNPSYAASAFDLVLGGQAVAPSRNADIQNNCNNNDSFDIAPYTMNTVDSFSDVETLYGSTFAEPEALTAQTGTAEGLTPGLISQNIQAIKGSSHPVPVSIYEVNMSTLAGAIDQQTLNSYPASLGAGLMVVDTMLQSMRVGIVNQNLFALAQYKFKRPDGSLVPLWGSVIDMGVTDVKRPQFLALQLANQAISNGATMIQTTHSGSDPTWNQSLVNTVQLNGAHYLQSYAFAQGSNYSLIIFNLSRSASLPVTFNGGVAPSGSVQMQQLTSASPSDNNENGAVVSIASSGIANFDPTTSLSLPPYSMTVLQWSGNPVTATPVISNVTATGITATSATITWTTDQSSSSQAFYGTTASYGSQSAPNSTLVTSHSMTISGLTPGMTYDYMAESINGSGKSAASTNFTFTTTSPAPMVSNVAATGITTTSATITWTTDQLSSSTAMYGTTTAYGSQSPTNSALVTAHSVTVTGLTPGTTYDYAAISANGSNASTTSANFTFTTAQAPPVISNVAVANLTATSVTISWTTDQATSSLVQYGTTINYGLASTPNSNLVTSHSVTLTGLTAGTAYNFDVVSVNASNLSSTSGNVTFTIPAVVAPYVGYVAYWGINNTGITVSWSTDLPATTQLAYGTTTALGSLSPLQPALTASHGVVLTTLNPGTIYYFVAQSTNSAGVTGYSKVYSFATTGTAATPAPVISNVTATSVTTNSATITWTTDQPTSSLVNFGTTTGYGSSSMPNSSLATTHSVTLTGLAAGTAYDFDVVSANANNLSSTSSNFTFSTTATTAPPTPVISNVMATGVTASSVVITWATDQATSSLVNYGTTANYGSASTPNTSLVTNHSVTLNGLMAGTTYNFDLVSTAASKVSGTSGNFTFTTTAAASTGKPPYVGYVAFWGVNDSGVTVSWSTDTPASTQLAYGTTTALGSMSPLQMALTTSHGLTLTGLNPGTTYYFVAQSTNGIGVTGYSTQYSFTTSGSPMTTGLPTISGVTVAPANNNTATVLWTTSVPTNSYVQYGLAAGSYNRYSTQTTLTTTPQCPLAYVPSGVIHYQVVSIDAYGHQAVSSDAVFVQP